MRDRVSLLDELREGGYEASLITTFNAYLPFYEEVVLRRLVNAGVRHNVLLMDAQQYEVSLHNHPPRLAGRQYTLMPITMPGAFHPKLMFLVGKKKALVVVGSHNMTLAGFGFNRELTNVIRIRGPEDEAGVTIGARVWREITRWIESPSHRAPQQIIDMVLRVRDFAPWIKEEAPDVDSDVKLLASMPGTAMLWDQVMTLTKERAIDVFVTGAFFDNQLSFLKRIQADLQPKRLFVALDPKTVQIPTKQNAVSGVTFVRADGLGDDEKGKEGSNGYLHAKGLFLRMENNESLFISGSANPSAPAWLTTDNTGNAEMMLVRQGISAEVTAEEMGFLSIPQMPLLDDADWMAISENKQEDKENEIAPGKTWLAVIEDNQIFIDAELFSEFKDATLILLDSDSQEITRASGFTEHQGQYVATFTADHLARALILRCIRDTEHRADFLLHHTRIVAEQARTNVQRRFKDALLSLETDTPNIGLLIECIDKIVFSDSTIRDAVQSKRVQEKESDSKDDAEGSQSLAIDVSEVKKRKSKQRLTQTGDFAYLLDTLIFHLQLQEDKTKEDLDHYGRSEEEQVGSDDDENSDAQQIPEQRRVEILALCHSKVHTVINRIITQLRAYTAQKQSLDSVLVRLLGVLAVLRELRSCDGRAQWVDKGKTTVPHEERLRLFEEVMNSLFEGNTSLLHLESLGEAFADSEDVARLKGLLLWLAWDCNIIFNIKKPFNESPEQLNSRLKHNAMILALAQAIQSDDTVTNEARQSIGIFTTSEMDWLKGLLAVASQCEGLKQERYGIQLPDEIQPGDIAAHKEMKDLDLRVVASSGGNFISLIKLSKDDGKVSYRPGSLVVARLGPSVSYH